jgi:hypothetical protein
MPGIGTDYYGHVTPTTNGPNGTAFTGATTGSAAGTIVCDGTIVTVAPSSINANDTAGQFVVVIASGEGSTEGKVATVYFQEPLAAAPKAILVNAYDATTAASVAIAATAQPLANTTQGFAVYLGSTGTAADHITIQYHVIL